MPKPGSLLFREMSENLLQICFAFIFMTAKDLSMDLRPLGCGLPYQKRLLLSSNE